VKGRESRLGKRKKGAIGQDGPNTRRTERETDEKKEIEEKRKR
jgi:hypothetical protein